MDQTGLAPSSRTESWAFAFRGLYFDFPGVYGTEYPILLRISSSTYSFGRVVLAGRETALQVTERQDNKSGI